VIRKAFFTPRIVMFSYTRFSTSAPLERFDFRRRPLVVPVKVQLSTNMLSKPKVVCPPMEMPWPAPQRTCVMVMFLQKAT